MVRTQIGATAPSISRAAIAAYTAKPAGRRPGARHRQAPRSRHMPMLSTTSRSACKIWARDSLFESLGGSFAHIVVLGGWYGVLAAMLFEDPSLRRSDRSRASTSIRRSRRSPRRSTGTPAIVSGRLTGGHVRDRLCRELGADLIVNTSCEHIADLRGWLDLLPQGRQRAAAIERLFQRADPHQLRGVARGLRGAGRACANCDFSGTLPMKNYTRFMLIGAV